MATYTTYKNLEKPLSTEKYNVGVANKNNDVIDSELHKLELKNESQDNLLATKLELKEHTDNKNNPHNVTKSQVGLGNVDNTSDLDKPVSMAQQIAINESLIQADNYTDNKIAELINGAPETLDTLKEVADAIEKNETIVEALDAAIGTKVNKSDLDSHINNNTIHVTQNNKDDWNAAKDHADSKHARVDATKVEKSSINGNIIIDGSETNVYTHPTTLGNQHIPSGGSSGQILKCSANGIAVWSDNDVTNVGDGGNDISEVKCIQYFISNTYTMTATNDPLLYIDFSQSSSMNQQKLYNSNGITAIELDISEVNAKIYEEGTYKTYNIATFGYALIPITIYGYYITSSIMVTGYYGKRMYLFPLTIQVNVQNKTTYPGIFNISRRGYKIGSSDVSYEGSYCIQSVKASANIYYQS